MDYEKLLKEAPDLSLDMDSLKQMLVKACLPTASLSMAKSWIPKIGGSIALMYDSYDKAIRLKEVNDTSKEVNELIYETNLYAGQSIYQFIELFSLCNVGYSDIANYYETLLSQNNLKEAYFFEKQMIQTVMQNGRYNNIRDHIYNNPEINLRPVTMLDINENDDKFIQAFRILNPILIDIMAKDLWKMCSALFMMDASPNTKELHLYLMEAWLRLIKCMDMVGHDWDSIGRVFSVYNYNLNKKP